MDQLNLIRSSDLGRNNRMKFSRLAIGLNSILRRTLNKFELLFSSYTVWKLQTKGYSIGKNVYVGPRSSIAGGRVTIGDHVTIVSDATFYGDISIGSNCIIAARCRILTRNHDYFEGNALPYGTDYLTKPVVIEQNVWVGNDVIIVPGVRIGEGAVVAMGSVVTKDVPRCAVVGGNPAGCLKISQPGEISET